MPEYNRTHEECDDCALLNVEPQPCNGHVAGPTACREFVGKAKNGCNKLNKVHLKKGKTMNMNSKEIATKIEECYNLLPAHETHSGSAENSDAMIMEFRKEKLKIASKCVFASLGIN